MGLYLLLAVVAVAVQPSIVADPPGSIICERLQLYLAFWAVPQLVFLKLAGSELPITDLAMPSVDVIFEVKVDGALMRADRNSLPLSRYEAWEAICWLIDWGLADLAHLNHARLEERTGKRIKGFKGIFAIIVIEPGATFDTGWRARPTRISVAEGVTSRISRIDICQSTVKTRRFPGHIYSSTITGS